MENIRQPSVAGLFYPADPAELQADIKIMLRDLPSTDTPPKALIVPHAGYIYSGPVAASAYATLRAFSNRYRRVVLLGPSHRVPLTGVATSTASAFHTPLGDIPLDRVAIERLEQLPQVLAMDLAHAGEHSLEVHLPFLQNVLDHFSLVPLVVGDTNKEAVAQVLDTVWGGDETLIVISSDLSHYHDYDTARQRDRRTCEAIESLRPEAIGFEDACGRNPLNGLLHAAKQHGLAVATLDLRNSGDTAGPRDRVVGYGAGELH